MSVLPDWKIENCVTEHKLIEPFCGNQLQPASYDVRLAAGIRTPMPPVGIWLSQNGAMLNTVPWTPMDPRRAESRKIAQLEMDDSGHVLDPLHFVLGSTVEWVNIPSNMVGRIEGKSSRARDGIQIHSAGYLDPGFCGNITLEIINFWPTPVVLWPDMLIGQLSFEPLTAPCRTPYSSDRNHYQQSVGVVEARVD